jgi:type I restriction enzyme R subunit
MLQSQQLLVADMLRPTHLLDLVRNFTVFQQVDGKTRKVMARYQQFRGIHKAVAQLQEGRTHAQGAVRDERGGIIWHTQGSGKSLSMVFLVRKMRMTPRLKRFKIVVVTDTVALTVMRKEKKPGKGQPVVQKEVTFEENIHFEEFPVLNESEEILILVDEAHRSHTRSLHRNPRTAFPNAAIIGFTGTPILSHEKTQTRDIFGEFIDKYLLQDAELDGATVPILYEGRTADGIVKDAPGLDELFEDMFRDYEPDELAVIKAKYATEGDVLEAPLLIEQKARDMIRHYVDVVLSEGLKAQVVATSRRAAATYYDKLLTARNKLVAELESLPATTLALPDNEIEKLDEHTQFLVRAHRTLPKLRALEIAAVFSGNHNDPESWRNWTDKGRQDEHISRFKRKFAPDKTEKTDPLSILIVNNMLLTGFDAPVEQVLYLDRKILAHDLLQAIARVNRTCDRKKCGYVVDYIGVARHLNTALKDYDGADIEGNFIDITVELPKLLDRRARAVTVFTDRGITDLQGQVNECVQLLEDVKIRADFINKLRMFYETLNVKVKALIDAHVSARGVDPKIPPTAFLLRRDARPAETFFRRWYISVGHGWLRERVKMLSKRTGTTAMRVEVRDLGFRWGSCGKNGVLFFDWKILQLPVRLVDYVITHELVHLAYPHHQLAFRQALERALPDWRERKEAIARRAKDYLVFGL